MGMDPAALPDRLCGLADDLAVLDDCGAGGDIGQRNLVAVGNQR